MIAEIGFGGMATVYRARQTLLDREVALKVLIPALAADPVNAKRFLQEARMLAALAHPGIVPVYEVGVTPAGLHYFSMQLLQNGDLRSRLRKGIDEAELVRVLSAVAEALGYAHARGYVHRDVTPANVMFDAHDKPCLTDFGIARALAMASRITASGISVGTAHYMSPEQARGNEVDPRSDIYSLGVMCYEALTGKPPYDGEDGFAVAFAHVHSPVPELPQALQKWQPLIDRCMAKVPEDRFQDCEQFIAMLRHIALDEPVPILPPPLAAAAVRDTSAEPAQDRAHAWLGPLAGVLGLVLAAGVVFWGPWRSPGPELQHDPPTQTPAQPTQPQASPVDELLALARQDMEAHRYTLPAGANALERYLQVLALDPANLDATRGIEQIATAYLGLADEHATEDDLGIWLDYLGRAEVLAQEHALGSVLQQVHERRQQRLETLKQEGFRAMVAWDQPTAVRAYERALQLQPDSEALARELAQARGIGTKGFSFRDDVDGVQGPQMVLIGQLAYSQSPITLAQFEHYWRSSGGQRFGSIPGTCRDRETLLRVPRRRDFRSPGFNQKSNHPVVCITAAMADDYARWLSQSTGKIYRIPSVNELRAVGVHVAGSCYANIRDRSYRDSFGGRSGANCSDGHAGTSPVGTFKLSGSGLYDTGGNVREWSADCGSAPACRERKAVGGSWQSLSSDETIRAFATDTAFNTIGFRVVREIP